MENKSESKIIFSVPVYKAKYWGPDDLAPWQHGHNGDEGLRFGEFYDVLFGYIPLERDGNYNGEILVVRVLDLDFDCGYHNMGDLMEDWDVPKQFQTRG